MVGKRFSECHYQALEHFACRDHPFRTRYHWPGALPRWRVSFYDRRAPRQSVAHPVRTVDSSRKRRSGQLALSRHTFWAGLHANDYAPRRLSDPLQIFSSPFQTVGRKITPESCPRYFSSRRTFGDGHSGRTQLHSETSFEPPPQSQVTMPRLTRSGLKRSRKLWKLSPPMFPLTLS